MASSWHGKTKYGGGGPPDSDVVPKYGGSRTSGLDASAPIWTPSPKPGHRSSAGDWSRQASFQSYSPSIPAQSPNSGFSSSHHHNGFGGQSQHVANRSTAGVGMGSPKYHQQSPASYHHQGYQQHQQGYYYPQQQQQGAQWQPSSWSGSVSPPNGNGGGGSLGSPVMMPHLGPGGQQIYNYQPTSPSPLGSSPSSPGTGVFLPSSLSSSRRPSKSSTITGMDSAAICLPDELF